MIAEGDHLPINQPDAAGSGGDNGDQPAAGDPGYSAREHKRELIGRLGASHTKVIEDVLSGILRAEHDSVTRARERPGFATWKANFYSESHPKDVSKRLKPVIQSLISSLEAVSCN